MTILSSLHKVQEAWGEKWWHDSMTDTHLSCISVLECHNRWIDANSINKKPRVPNERYHGMMLLSSRIIYDNIVFPTKRVQGAWGEKWWNDSVTDAHLSCCQCYSDGHTPFMLSVLQWWPHTFHVVSASMT